MRPVTEKLQRVKVWSGRLRLLHGVLALGVLSLLVSAWALGVARPEPAFPLREFHITTGYLVGVALLLRVYLLFAGTGTEHWRDFVPRDARQRLAAGEQLRFYLSAARTTLPAYYGHNPFWGPFYLGLFALLLVQVLSGHLDLFRLHEAAGRLLLIFTVLHVIAVVAHDWRGTASELSAMVSGYKIFLPRPATLDPGLASPPSVPVQSLQRPPKKAEH